MKQKFIILVVLIGFGACQTQETKEQETVAEAPAAEPVPSKTYAELSHYTGGSWNDRVYEGGERFVNVDFLRVPDEVTDHSYYIRYEGPGWESNLVGYRLYLDWRNATDIFGKLTTDMVLDEVGQDGYDSYHEPSEWGMDILKVGSSLGIGSVGRLVNDEVMHFEQVDSTTAEVNNAADQSSVTVNYYGWKTGDVSMDLTSEYSIKPDSRATKHRLTPSMEVEGLSTGIVRHDSTEFLSGTSENGEWAYIATYGVQTLVPDKLGMAIFYKTSEAAETMEGEFDHLVVFRPMSEPFYFYFLGAWEQEPGGIKDLEGFQAYLSEQLQLLNEGEAI